jgi:GntR family transcriptional repressor for pyruvate dehydrogenase complex
LAFEPIKRTSASEQVMQQIQSLIFDGTYQPGDRLPPERELAAELGVNRTTLREALKRLEQLGLLSIRHGDGTRVLDIYSSARIELLGSLLLSQAAVNPSLIENLFEAREVVGLELARKAARRRTPGDLEKLRLLLQQLEDAVEVPEVQLLELEFFYALAEAASNLFYVFLINSIRPVYMEFRELYAATAQDPSRVMRLQQGVVEALEAGDEKQAARKMSNYLEYGKKQVFKAFGLD